MYSAKMPPICARHLLKPAHSVTPEMVKVVCKFGEHDFVYIMCMRTLARIIDVGCARPAPEPHHWGIFANKNMGNHVESICIGPDFTIASLRGTGLWMVYETAGRYYNGMDAMAELDGLPKRGGKKSAVVTAGDEDELLEEVPTSDDSNYDSDGQLKPKAKPKRRKLQRKPLPENVQYRNGVVEKQLKSTMRVLTVKHLGEELCAVLAQLFHGTELGGDIESGFAHFYTNEEWLTHVGIQATRAGNDAIASVACELMASVARAT